MSKERKLTDKQLKFVAEYVKTSNASHAYRVAYDVKSTRASTIASAGHDLLNNPRIKQAINQLRGKAAQKVQFGVQDVLREWVMIATADVSELMDYRRVNCRWCHGKDHAYQYRDRAEFNDDLARVIDANASARTKAKRKPLPTDSGGYGFNATMAPNPECPKCDGEGKGDAVFYDTRNLSEQGKKLYAGVQITKDGVKVLTRDQDAALSNIAKALGMMAEKVVFADPHEDMSKSDRAVQLPTNPNEASKLYAAFMKKGR